MKENQLNNEILGVFTPKFYSLRNLTIVLSVVLLLPEILIGFAIGIAIKEGKNGYVISSLIVLFIIMIILIGYIIYLMMFAYRTMCYTLYKDKLILRCGVFKSIIFYSQIKKVHEESLDYMAFFKGGIFLENYGLGLTYFLGYGWITLYTTSCKNVIVITTDKKRYGITPQEKERFLSELIGYIESKDRD